MKSLFYIILGFLFLSACAHRETSTKLALSDIKELKTLHSKKIGFLIKKNNPEVIGQHHEGLLQVAQPWIFGLSDIQKQQLRQGAADLAAEKLIDELKKLGLQIVDENSKELVSDLWTIEVTQVRIDTYGESLMELGSTKSYWKAQNSYKISHMQDDKKEWIFNQEATVYNTSLKQLNANTILIVIESALKKNSVIQKMDQNPIEAAARLAAKQFSEKILSAYKNQI